MFSCGTTSGSISTGIAWSAEARCSRSNRRPSICSRCWSASRATCSASRRSSRRCGPIPPSRITRSPASSRNCDGCSWTRLATRASSRRCRHAAIAGSVQCVSNRARPLRLGVRRRQSRPYPSLSPYRRKALHRSRANRRSRRRPGPARHRLALSAGKRRWRSRWRPSCWWPPVHGSTRGSSAGRTWSPPMPRRPACHGPCS